MQETEIPLELIEEEVHKHLNGSREAWMSQVALGSAIFAVLAAITSLMANHHANEAMLKQVQASDLWSYYQAKSIKSNLLSTKMELLGSLGKEKSSADEAKFTEYKKQQNDTQVQAKEKEDESASHLRHHIVLARGVTLFQIAIAIAAISALTERRRFWLVSMVFGLLGTGLMIQGLWFV